MAKTKRPITALTKKNVMSSPSYLQLAKRAKDAASKARSIQQEVVASEVPRALMGSGAVITGSVAAGALRAFIGDNLMGVPADVAAGLVIGTAGVALGSPLAVFFAAGTLAGFVSDRVEEQMLTWQMGAGGEAPADEATPDNVAPFAATGTAG